MSHDHGNILPSYMKVFFTLCAMTLLTVAAAKLVHFPDMLFIPGYAVNIAVGLAIAVFKVICVMYIFMHLKFDNPMLRFFVYVPVFLFFVMSFGLNLEFGNTVSNNKVTRTVYEQMNPNAHHGGSHGAGH
ncbi:MAG: cytochrome C oxidase subunit IV family protein [Ignavibacteria bacterium]|jgi:caa(3)-type oxidase subunit IV